MLLLLQLPVNFENIAKAEVFPEEIRIKLIIRMKQFQLILPIFLLLHFT
jgi:hypothetical protein